ncbi:MAG TPA: transcriptional regulator, partial [Dokdonella sp.]
MAYRFDDFTLDPATRELRRDGGLVALPARAFDCLAYLLEHRERAVGRDELIAAVWGRADVSDALLNHTIVKLRRGLGDTGNEQRTIRTVPRFGYRWVGAVEVDAVDVAAAPPAAERAPAADAEAAPATDASALDSAPAVAAAEVAAPAAMPPRRQRRLAAAALAALAVIVLAAAALLAARRASPPAEVVDEAPPAAPVMVLPAEVSASEDWRWLRYGLMDLVANRLRAGAVPTAPSESVVGLLRQRAAESGDALLHDATLARSAALRVLPRVSAGADGWHVRLDAFGAQRAFSAEASAADAVQAARAAADRLLVQLGHARGAAAEELPPRLEALLEQSGAAMLADRLDEARALIVDAPPDLRGDPHLEQRLAQIDLRSGDYAAVETRLHALLDRLGPSRDATLRARAVLTLAAAYVRGDEPDKAADLYEEAIALRTPAADHEVLGIAHLGRSALYARQGRFGDATAEIARARVELETVGDALGVAGVDVNLGEAELMRHRPSDALPILKNAVREFERIGAREGRAYALAQQALAEDELLEVDAALATTERFWPAEQHTSNQR